MDLKCLSCDNSNESKLLDNHATPEIIEKLNFVSCLNFEVNLIVFILVIVFLYVINNLFAAQWSL